MARRGGFLRGDDIDGIQSAQGLQHAGVVAEGQGRVQPTDDVQFGDAQAKRLAGLLDDFLDGELEAVGVALLAGEGAELAVQDAVVRVVDVTVDDVAGAVAHFALPGEVGDRADGIQLFALKKAEGVGLGDPLAGGDFIIKVAEFALLDEKLHQIRLAEPGALAN